MPCYTLPTSTEWFHRSGLEEREDGSNNNSVSGYLTARQIPARMIKTGWINH